MHIGAGVAFVVVASVILSIVVCALLPFAFIAGLVWIVVRIAESLRGSRAAVASAEPTDTVARDIGWAAGLLVAGVLWCVGRHHFAALLLGLGTAYLTRALVERRHRAGT
jgi:hypothetical protein